MKLEIKDTESSTVYTIAHSGAIIGRERAKADIALKDEVISKRHARIFIQNGRWLLEDLGSSNGTYVSSKRLTEPVELSDGLTFFLAQHRFDVILLEKSNEEVDHVPKPENNVEQTLDIRESRKKYFQERLQQAKAAEEKVLATKASPMWRQVWAYFPTSVVSMLRNPVGFIQNTIKLLPSAPMSNLELAGYLTILGTLVGLSVGALLLPPDYISGTSGWISSLSVLIGSACLFGVIGWLGGFCAHTIVSSLIWLLGGRSDAVRRSNFLLITMTLVVVSSLPYVASLLLSRLAIDIPELVTRIVYMLLWAVLDVLYVFLGQSICDSTCYPCFCSLICFASPYHNKAHSDSSYIISSRHDAPISYQY